MAVVKVNGIEKTYPEGTTYLEIARDFQDQYENDILLVRVNGKLRELEKTLAGDSEISFITAKENAGYKTYERSAIFLMLKAFYHVVGDNANIDRIGVHFAVSEDQEDPDRLCAWKRYLWRTCRGYSGGREAADFSEGTYGEA